MALLGLAGLGKQAYLLETIEQGDRDVVTVIGGDASGGIPQPVPRVCFWEEPLA